MKIGHATRPSRFRQAEPEVDLTALIEQHIYEILPLWLCNKYFFPTVQLLGFVLCPFVRTVYRTTSWSVDEFPRLCIPIHLHGSWTTEKKRHWTLYWTSFVQSRLSSEATELDMKPKQAHCLDVWCVLHAHTQFCRFDNTDAIAKQRNCKYRTPP